MFSRILIVCVGNVCRSPMAEVIARSRFADQVAGLRVESAGLAALEGRPADPLAVQLMRARGLDLSGHRARQLTPELLREFELVLVMEAWHVKQIEHLSPVSRGKVFRLGHWRDFDIADPFQQPREAFEQAAAGIERGLEDLAKVLR